MKLKSMPFALLIMLVVLFASCSQKANVPVPEDAGLVFHLDGASLNSKLSWDEIKQGEVFKKAYEDINDSLARSIMNDIEQTGLDVKGDAFFFLTSRGRGSYATITCGIKDEAKFKALVTKVHKGAQILSEDGLSIVKDDDNVLTWNSDRVVFVGDAPGFNANAMTMHRGDGDEPPAFSADSLLKFAKAIYSLEKKNSLADDSRFTSMMKEKGDAHFWMNASSMYGNSMPAMLALTKASLLFEGNVSAGTINFGDGQITVDAKSYYNKELAKIYEKYSMKNIDESMLKKIPSQNVAAVVAMNYPPEGLKEFLTMLGVDGLLNMFLAQEGFTIDDFVKANKGDILLAVTDFEVKKVEKPIDADDPKSSTVTREVPDANIIFATSIKDKASFDKLVGLITSKIGESAGIKSLASKIPYKVSNDMFVAGNDSVAVNTYGTVTNDHAFISKISGHPMAGFIDIQKFIIGARGGFANDSVATRMADESLKYWQDIVFYGGEIKNGSASSHMEINMVDKKTNSLKQLNSFINYAAGNIFLKHKERGAAMEERKDSIAAPRGF
jgi:hypothetical protein